MSIIHITTYEYTKIETFFLVSYLFIMYIARFLQLDIRYYGTIVGIGNLELSFNSDRI